MPAGQISIEITAETADFERQVRRREESKRCLTHASNQRSLIRELTQPDGWPSTPMKEPDHAECFWQPSFEVV
jgi:hypothetical protein